jgi:hypothetical protein
MSVAHRIEQPGVVLPVVDPPKGALPLQERPDALHRVRGGLVVREGSGARFEPARVLAALPAKHIVQNAEWEQIELVMPAAQATNTEVVWDAQAEQLHVAVWSKRVPQLSERRLPRMLWYATFWRAGVDGARVAARLARGRVTLLLPRA